MAGARPSFGSPLTAELARGLEQSASAPGSEQHVDGRPTPTPPVARRHRLAAADGTSVHVTVAGIVIGRPSSVGGPDLPVAGPTVSRRHVAVWRSAGAVLCRDLGSRNGTFRRRAGELHEVPGPTGRPTLLLAGDELLTADGALLAVVADDISLGDHDVAARS
jgi:FHA domain